jgi:hypothetical protein
MEREMKEKEKEEKMKEKIQQKIVEKAIKITKKKPVSTKKELLALLSDNDDDDEPEPEIREPMVPRTLPLVKKKEEVVKKEKGGVPTKPPLVIKFI